MPGPWSIPRRANAIHEPSRCPRLPLLLHELPCAQGNTWGLQSHLLSGFRESAVPQQSSLTALPHDCDASLKLAIRCGCGPLPTRTIWRSLLRPHYAGSGVASCPKPWVNAHRAMPGREAKYVLGDIGVKTPHIPRSPILPMRLLISAGATLPAATGKYARTLTFCNGSRVATGNGCSWACIHPKPSGLVDDLAGCGFASMASF